MTQPPRERLEPHEFSKLYDACLSNDTESLAELIKDLNPSISELTLGLSYAIEHGNHIMMRYLLDQGIPVCGSLVEDAIRAKSQSIAALEMLREYGWEDVNLNLSEGVPAITALWYDSLFTFHHYPNFNMNLKWNKLITYVYPAA